MLYKDYSCKVDDLDQKGRVLVAANAIGNIDDDGDVSMSGSFTRTLASDFPRLKWFLNHDRNILLGVPVEGSEHDGYLKMLGQLNLRKQISRDIYEDYKLWAEYGRTLEHSVGVTAVKRNQDNPAHVEEWKLFEYSTLTSWGANPKTPMLGIKSMQDEADFMDYQLRRGNYSDERFRRIERKLKDIMSLLHAETEVPAEPTTRKHEAGNVAPCDIKATVDAYALRLFINTLNS